MPANETLFITEIKTVTMKLTFLTNLFAKSPLGSAEKRAEVCQGALHNIIFGFAGVWVPFLALMYFGYFRTREAIMDGECLNFAIILSAVSLGFFVKETQINLRRREMLTYAGLMIAMLVGVITRTALAFASKFQGAQIQVNMVCWVTVILVGLAILLNFRLFTLELETMDSSAVKNKLNQPAQTLSTEAKAHSKVDDIKL